MFAKYNYDNFPLVKVDLSGTIICNEDFTNFTQQWLELYNNKQYFEFMFDTKLAGLVHPKYCLYTALFIKSIKKQKTQYLKKSTIYVYNKYIYKLLQIIFYIEKPVAPVEILLYNNNEYVCSKIINN